MKGDFRTKDDSRNLRINILRGVAVTAVILFHTNIPFFRFGFLGVDIFLFISGFVIYRRYFSFSSRPFSFRQFYLARALRLLPSLLITLGVFSFALTFLNLPDATLKNSQAVISSIFGVSNLFYMRHNNYFGGLSSYDGFIHTWTLGLEEQFYLLLPLTLLLIRRLKNTSIQLGVSALIYIASLYFAFSVNESHPGLVFYTLPGRVFEFQSGMWVAVILKRGFRLRNKVFLTISAGILVLALSAAPFGNETSNQLFLMLAMTGVVLAEIPESLRFYNYPKKILLRVGLASYSIYLLHQPIFVLARLYSTSRLENFTYVYLIMLTLLFGVTLTRYVENPIRYSSNKRKCILGLTLFLVLVSTEQVLIFQNSRIELKQSSQTSSNESIMKRQYRWGTCFVDPKQLTNQLVNKCLESFPQSEDRIFVWGDSHAASIGSGMAPLNSRVSFLGLASCPTIFTKDVSNECRHANRLILNEILKRRPKVIVLAGDWQTHIDLIKPDLQNSVKLIQDKLPNTSIVLIGPLPRWSPTLSQQINRLELNSRKRINLVVTDPEGMKDVEERIQKLSMHTGIKFLLPSKLVCLDYSCPAILGPKKKYALTVYDDAHLTTSGAKIYATEIMKRLGI